MIRSCARCCPGTGAVPTACAQISMSPAQVVGPRLEPVNYVRAVEVTVRAYEPRDAADVADVFYRSVREVALSAYTTEQVKAWVPGRWDARQEHWRSGDGRLVLVASGESGHVVAFIDLEPDGHIDRLFCAPEAAGRGVASRLYDAIETAARAQRIKRLFTEASELARPFFERKGLRRWNATTRSFAACPSTITRWPRLLALKKRSPVTRWPAKPRCAASALPSCRRWVPRRSSARGDWDQLVLAVNRGRWQGGTRSWKKPAVIAARPYRLYVRAAIPGARMAMPSASPGSRHRRQIRAVHTRQI
jgi:putative acetyltransferase